MTSHGESIDANNGVVVALGRSLPPWQTQCSSISWSTLNVRFSRVVFTPWRLTIRKHCARSRSHLLRHPRRCPRRLGLCAVQVLAAKLGLRLLVPRAQATAAATTKVVACIPFLQLAHFPPILARHPSAPRGMLAKDHETRRRVAIPVPILVSVTPWRGAAAQRAAAAAKRASGSIQGAPASVRAKAPL